MTIFKKLSITHNKDTQKEVTPDMAIDLLKEGNARFVQGLKVNRDLHEQVLLTSGGQHPFGVILSCIDSRVPAETVFDLGIGDVFIIRIAGNFINSDILGSLEFACKVAGAKGILVLGHSQCGAIKGACDHVELGNLTGLLQKIQPAVNMVQESGDRTSANPAFVQAVAEANVLLTAKAIQDESEILRDMLAKGEIKIAGGMYDVATGEVTFTDI